MRVKLKDAKVCEKVFGIRHVRISFEFVMEIDKLKSMISENLICGFEKALYDTLP